MKPLHKWVERRQSRLLEFQTWWKLQNREDPESFPLEMKSSDWDEQFDIWMAQVGGE